MAKDISIKIKAIADDRDLDEFVRDLQKLSKQTKRTADRMKQETARMDSGFRKVVNGVKKLDKAMGGLMATFATGAAFSLTIYKLKEMLTTTIDLADRIGKLSTRLGDSTEALSEYRYVADRSGVSFRTLSMAFQRMTRRIAEAAVGTGEAKKALEELDLDVAKLTTLTPSEQFEILAEAIGKVKNESDKVRLAMKLFDAEGVAVLQIIKEGVDEIRNLRQEARDFGLSMDQDMIKQAVKAKDALTRFRYAIEGLRNHVIVPLLEPLTAVANILAKIASFSRKFDISFLDVVKFLPVPIPPWFFELLKQYRESLQDTGIVIKKMPPYPPDYLPTEDDVINLQKAKKAVSEFMQVFKKALSIFDLSIDDKKALASFETISAKLDKFKEDYLQRFKKLEKGEQVYGEVVKQVNEEVLRVKKRTAEQAASTIKSQVNEAVQAEIQAAEKIKQLNKSMQEDKIRTAELLQDLSGQLVKHVTTFGGESAEIMTTFRALTTEEEKWYARRREAQEKSSAATRAYLEGDYELAVTLAKEAQKIAKTLATQIKDDEGKIQVSLTQGMQTAQRIIRAAGGTLARAWQGQVDDADDANNEIQKRLEGLEEKLKTLEKEITGLGDELSELAKEAIDIKIKINADEALKIKKQLQEPTESTHTIHTVRAPEGSRWGGLVHALARGGQLPGWGGGDKIRALLEPGEFVIRKEAVREYGAGLFDLLNRLKLALPRIPPPTLGPQLRRTAFQTGGMVGQTESMPFLGRLELALPGGNVVEVYAPMSDAERIDAVMTRLRKTRG